MALNVTLAYLKESARQQADMKNSKFVTDDWLTGRINAHYAALYDKLVSKGEDYYTIPVAFPVTGNSDSYELPAAFYKLAGVDYLFNGLKTPMKTFMFNERWKYNVVSPLIPAQTLTLWIVPAITKLVADADVIDGVNGWEDWVIYKTARDALMKEESSTSDVDREIAALDKRIESMSFNRNIGTGERVKDVTTSREWPLIDQTSYRYRVLNNRIYFIGTAVV